MAGIYERIKQTGDGRISIHLLEAAFGALFVNGLDASKGATRIQLRDAINAELAEHGAAALTTAELNDLTAIADQLDAQTNNVTKLIYLSALKYVMIAAELGRINETKFRSDLGI